MIRSRMKVMATDGLEYVSRWITICKLTLTCMLTPCTQPIGFYLTKNNVYMYLYPDREMCGTTMIVHYLTQITFVTMMTATL